MKRIVIASAAGAALVLAAAAPARTAGTLTGTVGPGFTIGMSAKTVKAGSYTITIHDEASIHNFHLTGPGVDQKTSVSGVKTSTWKLKLKPGTYHFMCDAHSFMHGSLRVT
jgi:plastocyanin